jgi:hypothetical protein
MQAKQRSYVNEASLAEFVGGGASKRSLRSLLEMYSLRVVGF